VRAGQQFAGRADGIDRIAFARGTPQLTPRQWELLRLVAVGHTNAQIGKRLGISEGTTRKHLENIYARLQVSSRTAAVTRAFPDRALG
jgi:DNA-binding NarL/FixJ family response regulator